MKLNRHMRLKSNRKRISHRGRYYAKLPLFFLIRLFSAYIFCDIITKERIVVEPKKNRPFVMACFFL